MIVLTRKKVLFFWFILFVFNTLDIVFTLYGINADFILEGNPLMLYFLTNKSLVEIIIFKYFAVTILLGIILFKEISFFSSILIYVTTGLLGIIVLMHLRWLFLSFG